MKTVDNQEAQWYSSALENIWIEQVENVAEGTTAPMVLHDSTLLRCVTVLPIEEVVTTSMPINASPGPPSPKTACWRPRVLDNPLRGAEAL